VHIPKTAGTSLRVAAESAFGEERILRDYGPDAEATSEALRKEVYANENPKGILKAITDQNAVLVAGHVPIQKYGREMGLQNTVMIFREPVDQVVSHYRHAVAHHGFEGSLVEFSRREGIRNIQTRFLFNLDPALVGVIGITEAYRDSLELINARWGWDLRHRRKNVSNRFSRRGPEITSDERTELAALNQEDLALYQRACHVFKNSQHCLMNHVSAEPRGAISPVVAGEPVRGWAFVIESDSPAEIRLVLNGSPKTQVLCDREVEELVHWGLPRHGQIGFEFEAPLKTGDTIEITHSETGLVLDRKSVA
jgi:hypothetical protein